MFRGKLFEACGFDFCFQEQALEVKAFSQCSRLTLLGFRLLTTLGAKGTEIPNVQLEYV